MKRNLLILLPVLLILMSTLTFAQEIAMDFETTDCDGQQHHLFTELDEGKVIIVEFVMMNCSPCIFATQALNNIVQSYEETHPGRVKMYSIGYLDNYKCAAMRAWRDGASFTHPVFIQGSSQVQYYGGMGMPTFVVTGSNTHQVYYKSINGYNESMDIHIKSAIDSALLYSPLGMEEKIEADLISIYPSIFNDNFIIKTIDVPENSKAVIYDLTGKKQSSHFIADNGITPIEGSNLPKGMLILRIESKDRTSRGFKIIKQ